VKTYKPGSIMESLSALVIAARNGHREAFDAIVRRFQDMAYAGAYARLGDLHQAQDAAQEAFIDAYLNLDKLREPAAFPGWFRRIVLKHADRQGRARRPGDLPEDLPSDLPDPLAIVESQEVRETVQDAIAALPEDQRLTVTLFHIEEYSQKEVADFLELPVSTVKKRLFDARKRLKERMFTMVQETLRETRPSQDETFARKVRFFVALQIGDLPALADLLREDPDLIHARTEWGVTRGGVLPNGITPIFWAAKAGDEALLNLLLEHGAKADDRIRHDETPLHYAVMMGQGHIARLLIEKGAGVNTAATCGQTPLHRAVLRGDRDIVDLLLSAGAEVDLKDMAGRTPADWAALKNRPELVDLLVSRGAKRPAIPVSESVIRPPAARRRKVPVGDAVLGRILDGAGFPLDNLDDLPDAARQPLCTSIKDPLSPILETGIKAVDLFAPFKRGGHVGVFNPVPGTGKLVLLAQIARNVVAHHNGRVVFLGLAEDLHRPQNVTMDWWNEYGGEGKLLQESMVFIIGKTGDSVSRRQQIAETGLTMAEAFRQQGHDCLLILDDRLALTDAVLPYLRAYATATPEAAITTLHCTDHTAGLEPEPFADLDAIITFDPERARKALYPAVDPLRSRSALLRSSLLDPAHRQLVDRARACLRRYYDLRTAYEARGMEGLMLDDRRATEQVILRARRLDRFLTQPFHGTEAWTDLLGQTVPLEETLRGCREILDGKHDGLPENAFYLVGAIDQAVEKARAL